MTMRRFSRETQRNYLRDIERFATWLGRSPHTATAEEVRRFQIEQQEAGVPTPTMNMIVSALRFLFTQTLDRPDLGKRPAWNVGVPSAGLKRSAQAANGNNAVRMATTAWRSSDHSQRELRIVS